MIEAVVFDLDGTLVKFTLDVKTCRTRVIKFLTEEERFPDSLFTMKETVFDMLVKIKTKHQPPVNKQRYAKIENKVFSVVEQLEMKAAQSTEMFPGVPETLEKLKKLNLKLGLCTISGKKAAQHILNRFHISNYFDAVVTRENVSDVKPHPIHLETALKMLDVQPSEAVMVGDSTKDMDCASQLKVLAVGVTTGLATAEQLTHSGAHYITNSITDLPILIEQLKR